MYVRVDLRYDRVRDIEVMVEGLKRDIDTQRAVLELRTPVPRNDIPISGLLHKHNRVEDAWNSCRSKQCAPNDRVGCRNVIEQLRRPDKPINTAGSSINRRLIRTSVYRQE